MVYSNRGSSLTFKPIFSTEDKAYGRRGRKNEGNEKSLDDREKLDFIGEERTEQREDHITNNIQSVQVWQQLID